MVIKKASKKYQKDQTQPRLTLDLLGVPQIQVGDQAIRFPYLKAEALLYYLAVTGRPHSRIALATLLWGQVAEKQARNSLRNALYTIRRGLKPTDPLVIERDTICLAPDLVQLDVTRFQAAIEQPTDPADLAEALTLWRETFLDGFYLPDCPPFEEWLTDRRTHYETLYARGLLNLGQQYATEKRLVEAQRTIEKLLTLDPLHETGHQQLMRLYLQSGNRAAALRQYETLRRRLVEELGVDPAPASQALHLELLQADETPDLPHPGSVPSAKSGSGGQYRFVGRQQELAQLFEIYRATLPRGPAGLVMIEGEPGIGKTRLAREWLATLGPTRVLTTRCFEAEQAIPFQPWTDLIRTTLNQTPLHQLKLADVWLTELAHLVPEIRLQRPDLELSPITDPELTRGRIIQAIHHWLETLCREKPLAIFIDDWQWLDQASLTFLRYTLRSQQNSRLPLLILGAQRQTETCPGWPHLQATLERENILHRITLDRLSLSEVTALIGSMALPAGFQTDRFLERLLAETEGNPLFIIELVQTLTPETLKREQDWPIPRTIQTVIENRLARLNEPTYQIMSAAAVLGRSFTDLILSQISDLPLETTLQAIEEAAAANLITEQAAGYDFTHDKIRAVLLDNLTRSRRRHYHLRIATALAATLPDDFGLLGYHFEAGGDLLQARNDGLRAARQAVELYADEDALRWYDKVETLFGASQAELPVENIPQVIPFQQAHVSRALPLDILGLIYRQRGLIRQRIGQYDQAETAFQAALERSRARRRTDEQAAAHNLLSFLAYLRSDYNGVGQHAQQALDLATQAGQTALRGPGLRHLGISVYRTGDYAQALNLYDQALEAYRQANDRLGMAGVYNNIGFVLRTQAHYAQAIAAFEQALAIYRETGQVEGIALIHSNIGRTHAFSGDLDQAQYHLQRGLILSQDSHTDWITVKIHRTMGNVLAQNRQWAQALNQAQQAHTLAQTLGSDEDLGATLRLLAEIAGAWPESNLGDPTPYFEQSIAILQQVGAQDELERAKTAFTAYLDSQPV